MKWLKLLMIDCFDKWMGEKLQWYIFFADIRIPRCSSSNDELQMLAEKKLIKNLHFPVDEAKKYSQFAVPHASIQIQNSHLQAKLSATFWAVCTCTEAGMNTIPTILSKRNFMESTRRFVVTLLSWNVVRCVVLQVSEFGTASVSSIRRMVRDAWRAHEENQPSVFGKSLAKCRQTTVTQQHMLSTNGLSFLTPLILHCCVGCLLHRCIYRMPISPLSISHTHFFIRQVQFLIPLPLPFPSQSLCPILLNWLSRVINLEPQKRRLTL